MAGAAGPAAARFITKISSLSDEMVLRKAINAVSVDPAPEIATAGVSGLLPLTRRPGSANVAPPSVERMVISCVLYTHATSTVALDPLPEMATDGVVASPVVMLLRLTNEPNVAPPSVDRVDRMF